VNVSSIFGIIAPPGQTAYSAAKFALRGVSESLRHELGLVIGEELRARALHGKEVVLIGAPALTERYTLGLRSLGCASHSLGSEATWRGHWALARTLQKA